MKRKPRSRSGFFNSRGRIALFVYGTAACSLIAGRLPAFPRSERPATVSKRTLTFEQRVAYQRAIEEVYWRHRIWPENNPSPKPSLEAVMSQAQLEKKVADYLRESQALAEYWQRPITAEQLQAEMDRMARDTKQPEVLNELFEALGNDPFVIAECLARPVVALRLLTHATARQVGQTSRTVSQIVATASTYTLPEISDPGSGCADDWTATTLTNAPTARTDHTAVWTGIEMIIWGGTDNLFNGLNTGEKYTPSTDRWAAINLTNAPVGRYLHSIVWTGNEIIVWGWN